jgi:hypothetical protein
MIWAEDCVVVISFLIWSEPRESKGTMQRVMPFNVAAVVVNSRVFPPPVGLTHSNLIVLQLLTAVKIADPTSTCHLYGVLPKIVVAVQWKRADSMVICGWLKVMVLYLTSCCGVLAEFLFLAHGGFRKNPLALEG